MHFPKHFLFGAALSGHQAEGNNIHSNWWQAESAGLVPPSGAGANHYQHFDSDFAMARGLGLNAMRISIEWSRLQPQYGVWDESAIAHYHQVFRSLQKHGLVPMVTLFHWTMPEWLAQKGGFETEYGVKMFKRFVRRVVKEYGKYCQLWLTINEPEVFAFEGYLWGKHAPFQKNIRKTLRVYRNLIRAHREAYEILKRHIPHVKVGVAKNVAYHEPYRPNHMLDKFVVNIAHKFGNEFFIDRVQNQLDFIGLNYYFTHTLKFGLPRGFVQMNGEFPKSDMGEKTYPLGLYHILKKFTKYGKPMYVTENGIANARDDMRVRFIREHVASVARARSEMIPIKGYFYWALIDTYEWQDGFDRKFGLAEVDFNSQQRKPRISRQVFSSFRKK